MAVTSIWPIKGRVDKVINYACNPEKTTEAYYVENAALHVIDDVVEYAADDAKTERMEFVTGINCSATTAIRASSPARSTRGRRTRSALRWPKSYGANDSRW